MLLLDDYDDYDYDSYCCHYYYNNRFIFALFAFLPFYLSVIVICLTSSFYCHYYYSRCFLSLLFMFSHDDDDKY